MKDLWIHRPVEDEVLDRVDSLARIGEFVNHLKGREMQVFLMMRGGMNEMVVADELGVTRQRVSQILDRLRIKATKIFGEDLVLNRDRQRLERLKW